jgi:hypothetical protein
MKFSLWGIFLRGIIGDKGEIGEEYAKSIENDY